MLYILNFFDSFSSSLITKLSAIASLALSSLNYRRNESIYINFFYMYCIKFSMHLVSKPIIYYFHPFVKGKCTKGTLFFHFALHTYDRVWCEKKINLASLSLVGKNFVKLQHWFDFKFSKKNCEIATYFRILHKRLLKNSTN